MVSVPSRQDLLLEPHRHRPPVGADGEEAAGEERQGRAHRRAFSATAAEHGAGTAGATAEGVVVLVLPRRRQRLAGDRALLSRAHAPARHRPRSRLGYRAAERRGRARRDIPRDGEFGDDVRHTRLSGRSSAARHRAPIDREAFGRARARGLLPALRVADLGYRSRLSLPPGSRRRARCQRREARPRLAQAPAGARRARRLDRAAAGSAAGRLGLPIRQPALSRCRRHRGGRHGHGPRAGRRRLARLRRKSAARARMDRRHAERERRLGRVRCRQRILLSQQHSVRRPWRACSIRRPRT